MCEENTEWSQLQFRKPVLGSQETISNAFWQQHKCQYTRSDESDVMVGNNFTLGREYLPR